MRTAGTLLTATLAALAPAAALAQDAPIRFTEVVRTVEGFDGPEAVRYDPLQDVYFVSNFAGEPSGDANGFVSKVSADGQILEREFMVGSDAIPFHGGRGMYINGRHLWVADADGVQIFNRFSGQQAGFIDFTALEPGFLNDIVILDNGDAYVTDTRTSRLYRVRDGVASVAAETPFAANGVTLDPQSGQLLLVPWQGGDYVAAWNPGDGSVTNVGRFAGGGNFDGVEVINGAIVTASQGDESLHLMHDGADGVGISLAGRPADIGVDTRRLRVAVPYVALNRVDIIQAEVAE